MQFVLYSQLPVATALDISYQLASVIKKHCFLCSTTRDVALLRWIATRDKASWLSRTHGKQNDGPSLPQTGRRKNTFRSYKNP